MKFCFLRIVLVLASVLAAGNAVAKLSPIVTESIRFDDGPPPTAQQVRGYIIAGADRYTEMLPYKLLLDGAGEIQMTLSKAGKHSFTIALLYDASGFQIKYLSSVNLKYTESNGEQLIHPNYSMWIAGLVKQIKAARQLRLNVNGEPADPKAAAYLSYYSNGPQLQVSSADGEEKYGYPLPTGYATVQPLKVRGYHVEMTQTYERRCGPICLKFEPQGGRKYELKWTNDFSDGRKPTCQLNIVDVTEAVAKPIYGSGAC